MSPCPQEGPSGSLVGGSVTNARRSARAASMSRSSAISNAECVYRVAIARGPWEYGSNQRCAIAPETREDALLNWNSVRGCDVQELIDHTPIVVGPRVLVDECRSLAEAHRHLPLVDSGIVGNGSVIDGDSEIERAPVAERSVANETNFFLNRGRDRQVVLDIRGLYVCHQLRHARGPRGRRLPCQRCVCLVAGFADSRSLRRRHARRELAFLLGFRNRYRRKNHWRRVGSFLQVELRGCDPCGREKPRHSSLSTHDEAGWPTGYRDVNDFAPACPSVSQTKPRASIDLTTKPISSAWPWIKSRWPFPLNRASTLPIGKNSTSPPSSCHLCRHQARIGSSWPVGPGSP